MSEPGLEDLIGPRDVLAVYTDPTGRTTYRWNGQEIDIGRIKPAVTIRITTEDGEVLWERTDG